MVDVNIKRKYIELNKLFKCYLATRNKTKSPPGPPSIGGGSGGGDDEERKNNWNWKDMEEKSKKRGMDDRSSSGDNIEEELNDLKSEEKMDIKSEWDDYGNQNNQLLEQIDIITHNMHNNIDEYNDEAKENAYDTIRELVNIIEENNRKRDILLEKLLNNNALIINRTVEKNNIKLHTTLNDQHNEILNICEEFNRQLIEKEEQIQALEARRLIYKL